MKLASDSIRDYKLPFEICYRTSQLQDWPKKINGNIEVANTVFLEKSSWKLHLGLLYTNREKNCFW